ncbi:MAG: prepilin-type N-terminal cleavage/methylation domain-containing protein [Nitrospirota bacterium]|nr:prepilin-type N-terminal cleavage/methylation domain-containing protein [Nitrospirota bacterium]
MMRQQAMERGFTLLEVMVSVAIISTALVALLGLRNRDVQMQAHSRELTHATLLARNLMFETGQDDSLTVGYMEGNFGEGVPFVWKRTVNAFLIERVYQVDVSVEWVGNNHLNLTGFVEAPPPK